MDLVIGNVVVDVARALVDRHSTPALKNSVQSMCRTRRCNQRRAPVGRRIVLQIVDCELQLERRGDVPECGAGEIERDGMSVANEAIGREVAGITSKGDRVAHMGCAPDSHVCGAKTCAAYQRLQAWRAKARRLVDDVYNAADRA